MYHAMRWTVQKIDQRIQLVDSLVYRRQQRIGPFRYQELPAPKPDELTAVDVPVDADVDDSGWQEIPAYTHWGKRFTDFAMRTRFAVPAGWTADGPVALYLPLGEAGRFQPSGGAGLYRRRLLCSLRPPSPGDPAARRSGGRHRAHAGAAWLDRSHRRTSSKRRPGSLHDALCRGTDRSAHA